MQYKHTLPETYDNLKDDFSTLWTNKINHPWKEELSILEEFFWTSLTLHCDQINSTTKLIHIYT